MGLMVKDTRILVVGPPKSWLRVPQKVMPRNPDKLAHANCSGLFHLTPQVLREILACVPSACTLLNIVI